MLNKKLHQNKQNCANMRDSRLQDYSVGRKKLQTSYNNLAGRFNMWGGKAK